MEQTYALFHLAEEQFAVAYDIKLSYWAGKRVGQQAGYYTKSSSLDQINSIDHKKLN